MLQKAFLLAGLTLAILGCIGREDNSAGPARNRPALATEWIGRWQANPFAGTEWIEVRHQAHVYRVEDPKAVASLLQEIKITAIQNDAARGSKPPAFLTFHKKGGPDLWCGVEKGACLGTRDGLVFLRSGFFDALNRQLSKQEKQPINVLQPLASLELPSQKPPVQSSAHSLTAGFVSMTAQYTVGGRLHRAMIVEPESLIALHKALKIVKQESARDEKPGSRELIIVSKDGSTFYGHIGSLTVLSDFNAGKFTLTPDFFHSLNQYVSQLEGYSINLAGENALPEPQAQQEKGIRRILGQVKALQFSSGNDQEKVTVDDPKQVAKLIQALSWLETPARMIKAPKGDLSVELTMKDGKKVLMTYQNTGNNNERVPAAPLTGDLIEMTEVGLQWIDNQWK